MNVLTSSPRRILSSHWEGVTLLSWKVKRSNRDGGDAQSLPIDEPTKVNQEVLERKWVFSFLNASSYFSEKAVVLDGTRFLFYNPYKICHIPGYTWSG